MICIEIDDHDYDIVQIVGVLAEADDLVVVDVVEPEIGVALQRLVLSTYPVHARDETLEAVRAVEIPVANLVFLRIEVFLAAGVTRAILA